jgi:hypothetical protein
MSTDDQIVARDPPGRDTPGGVGQRATVVGPKSTERSAPVDLLGDVGQVEEDIEGPDELAGGGRPDIAQQVGGGGGIGPRQPPNRLDQVEQLGAGLTDERLAQQLAEAADVASQRPVGVLAGERAQLGGTSAGRLVWA